MLHGRGFNGPGAVPAALAAALCKSIMSECGGDLRDRGAPLPPLAPSG